MTLLPSPATDDQMSGFLLLGLTSNSYRDLCEDVGCTGGSPSVGNLAKAVLGVVRPKLKCCVLQKEAGTITAALGKKKE